MKNQKEVKDVKVKMNDSLSAADSHIGWWICPKCGAWLIHKPTRTSPCYYCGYPVRR